MFALILEINIPLMFLAFALWVGIPLWLVLRRPNARPQENSTMPAYIAARRQAVPAQRPAAVPVYAGR